jgi:hypothetical protein
MPNLIDLQDDNDYDYTAPKGALVRQLLMRDKWEGLLVQYHEVCREALMKSQLEESVSKNESLHGSEAEEQPVEHGFEKKQRNVS